jgi:hypothetical protein
VERGNYRSIHTVIVDGPDFQALSPGAKLVWYTLKMTLGPSGIDVVPALVATLVERTGADTSQVEKGLTQLEQAGWLKRERNVVWMVDGLKHDPHFQLTNQNHRTQVARHVNGLPRLAIVDAFRLHYGLAAPPSEMPSQPTEHGLNGASKMPSKDPSKSPSIIPSKKASGSREKGKGEGTREKGEGTLAAPTAARRIGRPSWLAPFATAWREKYGGEMSAGKAVKALSRLVELHGADEVLRRWTIYLAATAAEYANAPKFAETWGRWAAAVVRTVPANTNGAPSANDQARAEAGEIVAKVRALVFDQPIPGQGSKKLLRSADIEAMGPDIAAAVRNTGGVAQVLKLEAGTVDVGFYVRDFAAALYAARHPTSEAQSA